MARDFSLNYYYALPEYSDKINAFLRVSGDTEIGLISQYVRGWISRNRKYYTDLAKFDASQRRLRLSEWGKIVIESGMDGLPALRNRPVYPSSDLPELGFPIKNEYRCKINKVILTTQNFVFLRLAIYYEKVETTIFISKVVKEHLDRNWDNLYEPQVQAENLDSWDSW